MNKKDYVFEVKWNEYVVGILAQFDKDFYLIMKDKKDIKEAAKKGFIGIPGFIPEKVYKSNELFDFFKSRVLKEDENRACEILSITNGKSMIDSFLVDKVSEEKVTEYKTKILEAHRLQEMLRVLRERQASEQEMAAIG